jgi:hypothetical protein
MPNPLPTLWNKVVTWIREESVTSQALVQAFIALGIAFSWWHWSNQQVGAVVGIVAAVLAMFTRSQVTPVSNPRSKRGEILTPGPPGQ